MADQTTHVDIEVRLEVQKQAEIDRLKRQLDGLKKQIGRYASELKKPIFGKKSIIDTKVADEVDRLRGSLSRFSDTSGERAWRRLARSGQLTADTFKKARAELEGFQRRARNAGGFKNLDDDLQRGFARSLKRMRLLEYSFRRMGEEVDLLRAKEVDKADEIDRAEKQLATRRAARLAREQRQHQSAMDQRLSRTLRMLDNEMRAETRNQNRLVRLQRQRDGWMFRDASAENRDFDRRRAAEERDRRNIVSGTGRHVAGARASAGRALHSLDQPYFHSPVFYLTLAGAAATAFGVEAFGRRIRNQNAEKMLEVFGDYGRFAFDAPADMRDPGEVKKMRRDWIDKLGVTYGLTGDRALDAVAEGRRAGIPKEHIEALTKQAFQLSHALEADIKESTHLMGISFSLLGRNGGGLDAVKDMNNAIAVAAQATAADANEVVSGMRRGAGALAYGMTPKDLAAIVATGASVGIQAGKSGTLTVRMLDELITAPNQGKDRQSDILRGLRTLGIRGNLKQIAKKTTADPGAMIEDILTRAEKLDPTRRVQALNDLFQDMWGNEANQLVQGLETFRRAKAAVYDPSKAHLLETISSTKLESFDAMLKSARASFDLIFEDLGSGLDQAFTDASKFFAGMGLNRQAMRLNEMMAAAINGVVGGFGFSSLTELLQRVFGSGRTSDQTLENIGGFFFGLAEGLKSVFTPILDFFRDGTGKIDYQAMGKAVGLFTGLTMVLHAARPFLGLAAGAANLLIGVGHLLVLFVGFRKLLAVMRVGSAIKGGGVLAKAFANLGRLVSVGGIAAALGSGLGVVFGMIFRVLSPVFWVLTLIHAFRLVWNNWGAIQSGIKAVFVPLWTGFKDAFIAGLKEFFFVDTIVSAAKLALADLKQVADVIVRAVEEMIEDVKEGLNVFLPEGWEFTTRSNKFRQQLRDGFTVDNPGSLKGQGDALREHFLKGGSGSNGMRGSGGFDDLSVAQSLGYQSETVRGLDRLNASTTQMVRLLSFNDGAYGQMGNYVNAARSTGDFSFAANYSGPNRHLMRPGMRGGSAGVGGQGSVAGRRFGGSGGAARAAGAGQPAGKGGGNLPMFNGNGSQNAVDALTTAEKYLGLNEYKNTGTLKQFMGGWDPRGAAQAWCARFMNSALESNGIKGTGSELASSFLNWGQKVLNPGDAKAGDILVDHRGRQAGQKGAHVGMFTGQTRQGPRGLQMEMLGGNQDDGVTKQWVDAGKLAIRRAQVGQRAAQAANKAAQAAQQSFEAPANAAGLPAGMRNNNPGNLKWSGSPWQQANFPGMIGPSENRDEGTPQIKFATAQDGLNAMSTLIDKKFADGRNTVNKMVSAPGGWTPGKQFAADNIAQTMGVRPNDPLDLANPETKKQFMRALMKQEHGAAAQAYTDEQLNKAVGEGSYGKRAKAMFRQSENMLDRRNKPPVPLMPQGIDAMNRDVQTRWQRHLKRQADPAVNRLFPGFEDALKTPGADKLLKPNVPPSTLQQNQLQKPPTPDALIRDVPSANGSGGNRTTNNQFGGPQTNIHIHGSGQDHHGLAAAVQRRISEVWTRRTSDLETDIA